MASVGESGSKLSLNETVFLALVGLVVWAGNETSAAGDVSPWFRSRLFGVPLNYLLLAVLITLILPYIVNTPRFVFTERLKSSGLWIWVVLTWLVVSVALAVALLRGVPELFADWRNLAVAAVVAVVAGKWLAVQTWRRFAIVDLAITFGLLSVPIMIGYATGSGSVVGGVRTTVFDGTTLYLASFAAITGAWYLLVETEWLGRVRVGLVTVATVSGSLVVLLSLRRSFWLVWAVGLVTVLIVYLRTREVKGIRLYVALFGSFLMVAAAFLWLGTETIVNRLGSFSPESTGSFSATNEDHVNDLLDAWRIIEREPILGLGIGQKYETQLISDWKLESFEVHNAILHVWLKFGLIGAVAYIGFHVAWARYALRTPPSGAVPIGAFVVGTMVATLAGTWPYNRFQLAVFFGLLLTLSLIEPRPTATVPSTVSVGTARRSP